MTSTKTVVVNLGGWKYDICIGAGLLDTAGELIKPVLKSKRVFIVTDENTAAHYSERLQASLEQAGIECAGVITVPPGKSSKSFEVFEGVITQLLDQNVERSSTLIALGGGVVGDLTGFAAAVVMRGIPFIQIPTTLLAQVDSSVGGKTGINVPQGKNLVGAFYQPEIVIADTDTLQTLPQRELLAGYAEVVKYGLINKPAFFEWLEEHGESLLKGDAKAQQYAIEASCQAKAEIVAEDEREAGVRALLNLGHTFGHALEAEAGYDGSLLHGEAVAIGMVMSFDVSVAMGVCPPEDAARARAHIERMGLPIKPPATYNVDALLGHMTRDKKVKNSKVHFILAHGIGKAYITDDVDIQIVRQILEEAMA